MNVFTNFLLTFVNTNLFIPLILSFYPAVNEWNSKSTNSTEQPLFPQEKSSSTMIKMLTEFHQEFRYFTEMHANFSLLKRAQHQPS